VSADLLHEEGTGRPYYEVRLALAETVSDHDRPPLLPGMPVEAYIATGERTPLEFLLKPLTEQFQRAFRER
jgi:HlyD family secretion protein